VTSVDFRDSVTTPQLATYMALALVGAPSAAPPPVISGCARVRRLERDYIQTRLQIVCERAEQIIDPAGTALGDPCDGHLDQRRPQLPQPSKQPYALLGELNMGCSAVRRGLPAASSFWIMSVTVGGSQPRSSASLQ
jgi:hypothetical protein